MFEIGQRVVCVTPLDEEWGANLAPEHRGLLPKNLPQRGSVYTVREVVSGSVEVDGPSWTKAPGFVGLLLVEVVNEPTYTTNGRVEEQAFDENNFMPLLEAETGVETTEEVDA